MASNRVDSIDDAIDLEYESGGSKCEAESEGDQEEVSVSQLLQGKRSKVWEHFRPYQVKTLISLKDREGNVVKDENDELVMVPHVRLKAKCVYCPEHTNDGD
ncbi:hypothetical protein EV2_041120 [Malus domestica]